MKIKPSYSVDPSKAIVFLLDSKYFKPYKEASLRKIGREAFKLANIATKVILSNYKIYNVITPGDLVFIPVYVPIRNNGIFFWDGNKVINLDYSIDKKYGDIPEEFEEYDRDYWNVYSVLYRNKLHSTDF